MKYIDEYRDRQLVDKLLAAIRKEAQGNYCFMEVCGSHTHAIRRHGLPSLLPGNIRLLSGPGCPVCVSDQGFIDRVVNLASDKKNIIAVFGDLLRVPGSIKSLMQCREEGADVRLVYSPLKALDIARDNPSKDILFPAIGFETTAPSTAVTLRNARRENLQNFYVLSAHKLMPPAMHAVIDELTHLNGYICPGHVSAITGSQMYKVFPEKYNVATVIAGFEPTDILQAVLMLVRQVNRQEFSTEIQYKRAVPAEGNLKALKIMEQVFDRRDDHWRGLGLLPKSGLKPASGFSDWDAEENFSLKAHAVDPEEDCICGDILKGLKEPGDCPLFAVRCTPENPRGTCMVSAEGSCQAYFKYQNYERTY